jgi:hypothetical protein
VAPNRPWRDAWIAAAVLGGCLPPDEPVKKPAPVDELVHAWRVAAHVSGAAPALTAGEAEGFHGRTIEVSATGYVSPWQGTCEDAGRTKRKRIFADVATEIGIPPTTFGFPASVTEYRLSCNDHGNPPPLLIWVAGDKAITCFNDVCFLLKVS